MHVSIGVTNYSWPSGPQGLGAELVRLVRAADQAGVAPCGSSITCSRRTPTRHPTSATCSRPTPPLGTSPPTPNGSGSAPW